MEAIKLTNVEIKDKTELFHELRKHTLYPMEMIHKFLNKKEIYVDENTYRRLLHCKFVSFDDNYETQQAKDDIWYKPTINENGNIENKQGLTESEKWFNSLSDREKEHVKYLANNNFSNMPACG